MLNPTVFKCLKHGCFSNVMNNLFHKRSLFRNQKKTEMKCAQGRKGVIFSGFLRWGFLCQVVFNGDTMKVIYVIGDSVSHQKMILTKKNLLLKVSHFRILWDLLTFSMEVLGQRRNSPRATLFPGSGLYNARQSQFHWTYSGESLRQAGCWVITAHAAGARLQGCSSIINLLSSDSIPDGVDALSVLIRLTLPITSWGTERNLLKPTKWRRGRGRIQPPRSWLWNLPFSHCT